MIKYAVHFWLRSFVPAEANLVSILETTSILMDVECRVTHLGDFTSVYIIADDDNVDSLSSFGTPIYKGRL